MECQDLPIPLGSLVLLSGPPGCGKTTACQSLEPSMVVSSDRLRESFFGVAKTVVDGQAGQRPMAVDDSLIFSVMAQVVRSRLRAGLTTVVDATLLTDRERRPFAAIATEFHVPIQVVIFDLPEAQVQRQNAMRPYVVPRAVVSQFFKLLNRQSRWPFVRVTAPCRLVPVIPTIPDEQAIDAIGDVHGLAEPLRQLIRALGYDDTLQHPRGRKLCFLGDLVDRGLGSLEVLDLVMAAVAQGHYCIRGNHDMNLGRGVCGDIVRSRATRETLHHLLQRDAAYQERVRTFIMGLPTFYQYRNYVLCHGDIEWFHPLLQPGLERVYGRCRMNETYDTDQVFRQTMPDWVLVRGHIPLTSQERSQRDSNAERVYSLDEGAGFGGPLVAMRLPEREKVRVSCAFNYHDRPSSFGDRLESLVAEKLVKRITQGQLTLYKYTAKAFSLESAWQEHPDLKLARGVVVGLHGEPVSYPFPRTFNYLEQGTTLPLDTAVVAVEKLNGFLVTTFLHPYQPDHVLVTCSGSFEGEYVELAKGLLFQDGLYGKVLQHLCHHATTTLLWEAIHPNDSHIISYGESRHGLHLIGVGEGQNHFWDEPKLDDLAKMLSVPRPSWFSGTFQQALEQVRQVNHEGFMIRRKDGSFALKLKSPYYLRTKFLARMTARRAKFMFASPAKFKQEIDEELWPLADAVIGKVSMADWLAWSDVQRRDFIQAWMDEVYFDCR